MPVPPLLFPPSLPLMTPDLKSLVLPLLPFLPAPLPAISSPISPDGPVSPTAVEVDKQLRLGALGKDFLLREMPRNAIIARAHVLYKIKADDRDTCRIATMGDQLLPLPSGYTFAAVVSEGPKVLAIQAHCQSRGNRFLISDADVVGGVLHIPLHSPVPMYLLLP